MVRDAREAGIACASPQEPNEELLAAAYAERFGLLAEEASVTVRLEGALLDTNVLIDYALGREPQSGLCGTSG